MDTINIGKRGLTLEARNEIKARVKAKGLIKVKVLNCKKDDFKSIACEVSKLPKVEVIKTIGFTVVLQKK